MQFIPNLDKVAFHKTGKLLCIKLKSCYPINQLLNLELLIINTNPLLGNLGRKLLKIMLGTQSKYDCIYVVYLSLKENRIELVYLFR